MNLYRTTASQDFFYVLTSFILNNFSHKLDKVKIILPSGYMCFQLQEMLIKERRVTFLPNIIPLSDIAAEGEEVFKIPSHHLGAVSQIEEKIILTEAISSYQKLNFDIIQSLKFSSILSKLFYDLDINNIDINLIDKLSLHNKAEHLQVIYEFLLHIRQIWQEKITKLNKLDRANFQKKMLEAEINRLTTEQDYVLIIAGIISSEEAFLNFIKAAAALKNSYIILPPSFEITEYNNYCLTKLLSTLNKNLADFDLLSVDDQFIKKQELLKNISYYDLDDIFYEAELISNICHNNFLNKTIAIFLNNQKNKDYYCNFLAKRSIEFHDLTGINLTKIEIFNLIIAVSELLCSEFSLKKLFVLLKNPLIIANFSVNLEKLLTGKNRFVSNWQELISILESLKSEELLSEIARIYKLFSPNSKENKSFNFLLTKSIKIAEKLCHKLWYNTQTQAISEFFSELVTINWNIELKNISDFPETLKSLVSGARIFKPEQSQRTILICRPEDAYLLKFDLAILADFNEGTWPSKPLINPWLSKQMQEEIGLYTQRIKSDMSLYIFYMILHNTEVIITRSKKQANSQSSFPSSYLLRLQTGIDISSFDRHADLPLFKWRLKEIYLSKNTSPVELISPLPNSYKEEVCQEKYAIFPSKLSATDIEMLVRNPYGFYAKKILNLKKQKSLAAEPQFSDFGNFVHKVIENYTKNYDATANKIQYMIDISSELINETTLFKVTKKIWQTKLAAIAEDFVEFDEQRRHQNIKIYSEIAGELVIDTATQQIKITAIADRIELNDQGEITILDYKTGALPSRQDIVSGLSPQLLIEAMIAQNSGFGMKIKDIKEIIYVKISSSKPYIQTTEIKLTPDELMAHQIGLKNILEYYINNMQFYKEIDLAKYNDYQHLARLIDYN